MYMGKNIWNTQTLVHLLTTDVVGYFQMKKKMTYMDKTFPSWWDKHNRIELIPVSSERWASPICIST